MLQEQLLSIADVAAVLGCTTSVVQTLVDSRSLPAVVVLPSSGRQLPFAGPNVEYSGDVESVLVLHERPRRLDRGERGYLRVKRSALDAFVIEHATVAVAMPATIEAGPRDASDPLDPSDLPDELDCANQAFRAISNGYGDVSDTFRNRLVAWLVEHRGDLGIEGRERIATVANRDKAAGRKVRKSK